LISDFSKGIKAALQKPPSPPSSFAKMSPQKEAMDIDPLMSIPSTSSIDVMKLIDNKNHITTVQETEQWTVRGWLTGIAIFHKHDCRCCNDYVAHIIHACREQSVDLPLQAVSNTVTKAWLMFMCNLESEATI
jgi:hypothetical protein